MARTKVKVEGLRELERALGELPVATGKAVLRRTLMAAGEPVADDAASRAPELRGDLRVSIDASTRLSRRQARQARKASRSTVEAYIGAGALPQAHLQEFGTSEISPQPFLRPAWEAGQRATLDRIKDRLAAEIAKAAKRLERKAARAAAKVGR